MLAGDLMSSALFGHRRGAFTGAVSDSAGKVAEAEHGTLFLDEIGDLTPDAQARLLRFLHDRTYDRLGDTKEWKSDVRVIAATNRALEEDIQSGRFREDLFFRLNVLTLTLPPLRERREDAVPLARYYLQFLSSRQGRGGMSLSEGCERAIEAYPWPGNMRELRNAVERAVILAHTNRLEPADLGLSPAPGESDGGTSVAPRVGPVSLGGDFSLEDVEREHIARVVARSPSLEASARLLGIDPTTLQRKRKRYGLT
jgi:NtrC-family two-component system response regulator AlgB